MAKKTQNIASKKYHKTQLYYDELMLFHEDTDRHVECPARISETNDILKDLGIKDLCEMVKVRQATEEELLTTHDKAHVSRVLSVTDNGNFDGGIGVYFVVIYGNIL